MAAIEINGISKRFGSVQAVSDLSFEVDADVDFLGFGAALAVMAAWIAALFAAGAALLRARDVE